MDGVAQTVPNGEIAVLVHGLASHRLLLRPIERHLRRSGYATLNYGYRSIFRDIQAHAERLATELQRLEDSPPVSSIHLVTHSMGGVVARTILADRRFAKLRSLVMLGPPNHGSRVAAILSRGLGWLCKPLGQLSDAPGSFVNSLAVPSELEIGIIASRRDRVVALSSTHLRTERDHIVVSSGHNSMLFRRDVANYVATFLRHRSFEAGTVLDSTQDSRRELTGASCP